MSLALIITLFFLMVIFLIIIIYLAPILLPRIVQIKKQWKSLNEDKEKKK